MKPRPPDPASRSLGSVHRDEVLLLSEACRRLGWASRMMAQVQRMGLETVTIGRTKVVTGEAVYRFVERMMQQAGEHEQADKEP